MHGKKAKKLMAEVKETYEEIAEDFSSTRNYIGQEFPHFLPYLKKAEQVVDLGCGNGRFAGFVKEQKLKCRYLGIDNSSKFIKIAQAKYSKYAFVEGDQLNIPLDENSTDVIMNIRAFHHIPSKKFRIQALYEMQRVLKKDGIVIISVWNLWQKKYWKQLAAAIVRTIFTLGSYAPNDTFIPWKNRVKRYYHAFTQRELRNIVKKANFKVLEELKIGKDLIIIAKK